MESESGIDIDLGALSAQEANEVRALFEASAGTSHRAGRVGQAHFLQSLAGLVDAYLKGISKASGEPLPEPLKLDASTTGGIDLAALSLQDLARGASVLLRIGEALDADGHVALGSTFADLANVLVESAKAKQAALAAAGQAETGRPN